eukprot:scaffold42340_cov17-Tisochrysis_lutea.AAC.2
MELCKNNFVCSPLLGSTACRAWGLACHSVCSPILGPSAWKFVWESAGSPTAPSPSRTLTRGLLNLVASTSCACSHSQCAYAA